MTGGIQMYEHDFIFKTVYDLKSGEIKYDK